MSCFQTNCPIIQGKNLEVPSTQKMRKRKTFCTQQCFLYLWPTDFYFNLTHWIQKQLNDGLMSSPELLQFIQLHPSSPSFSLSFPLSLSLSLAHTHTHTCCVMHIHCMLQLSWSTLGCRWCHVTHRNDVRASDGSPSEEVIAFMTSVRRLGVQTNTHTWAILATTELWRNMEVIKSILITMTLQVVSVSIRKCVCGLPDV